MLAIRVSVRLPRDQAALARTFSDLSWSDINMAFAVSATNMTSCTTNQATLLRELTLLPRNFSFLSQKAISLDDNFDLEIKIHLWNRHEPKTVTISFCAWIDFHSKHSLKHTPFLEMEVAHKNKGKLHCPLRKMDISFLTHYCHKVTSSFSYLVNHSLIKCWLHTTVPGSVSNN